MTTFNNTASLIYNGNTISSNTTTGELVEVLSATKTALENDYEQNSPLTFAVSIINSGTSTLSGLTLTDNLGAYTFTPTTGSATTVVPLTYQADSVKYYVNGTLQTAPTVSATNPLTVTGLSVPAGGNAMLLYSAQTNSYAPLATGSTINNTASLSGASLSSTVPATETVNISNDPQLTISKSLSPTTVTESGTVVYTITIMNTGNTAVTTADDVIITDTFNPILQTASAQLNGTPLTSSQYTYSTTTGVFSTTDGTITVPAATYTQSSTGEWQITPGVSVLEITGTM